LIKGQFHTGAERTSLECVHGSFNHPFMNRCERIHQCILHQWRQASTSPCTQSTGYSQMVSRCCSDMIRCGGVEHVRDEEFRGTNTAHAPTQLKVKMVYLGNVSSSCKCFDQCIAANAFSRGRARHLIQEPLHVARGAPRRRCMAVMHKHLAIVHTSSRGNRLR
jgi:hypothetical protein